MNTLIADPPATPWRIAVQCWRPLARRVWQRFRQDRITDQSAKLSFYFLLAIFPLLLVFTSILGLAMRGREAARELVQGLLARVVPSTAVEMLEATLEEIMAGAGGLQLSLALLATLWTASRGMAAVIEGLNVAYEIRQYRSWWRRNLLAVGLTVAMALCLAAALLLLMEAGRFGARLAGDIGVGIVFTHTWRLVEVALMLALVLTAFNLLYIVAPNLDNRRWHWLMPGTVVGVALWLAASYGFKLYLQFFDRYSVTYGSIGAVIVLMLWFYVSGIAVLVGGEVNSEIEKVARAGEAPVPKEES